MLNPTIIKKPRFTPDEAAAINQNNLRHLIWRIEECEYHEMDCFGAAELGDYYRFNMSEVRREPCGTPLCIYGHAYDLTPHDSEARAKMDEIEWGENGHIRHHALGVFLGCNPSVAEWLYYGYFSRRRDREDIRPEQALAALNYVLEQAEKGGAA